MTLPVLVLNHWLAGYNDGMRVALNAARTGRLKPDLSECAEITKMEYVQGFQRGYDAVMRQPQDHLHESVKLQQEAAWIAARKPQIEAKLREQEAAQQREVEGELREYEAACKRRAAARRQREQDAI